MTPERHQRIKRLFLAAVELAPSEVDAFLQSACGDDGELRTEIESLLENHRVETLLGAANAADTAGLLNSALVSTEQSDSSPDETRRAESARPAGTMVAGRYRLIAPLGQGGMSVVYRAEDTELQQEIALKFLGPALRENASAVEILRREVRTARQVTHPNVVRIFDLGVSDGDAYVTMEFVAGDNLASLVRQVGPLPAAKVLQIARQLAAAISAAHEAGVLHRDLKPANVMIDDAGSVRILDFGIASPLDDQRALRRLSGTPGFVAPEILDGQPASEQSDLFGWGLVVFYAATGELPTRSEAKKELDIGERLRAAEMDEVLTEIVCACLESDPARRPGSARQLVAALANEDLLQATVRAGRMPSPALLTASASWQPSTLTLDVLFGSGVALLVLIALLASRTLFLTRCGLVKSPEALREVAEDTLGRLGYQAPAGPLLTGVTLDTDCLQYVRAHSEVRHIWSRVASGDIPAVFFWFRRGDPRLPRPELLGSGDFELKRQPLPGTAIIHLDGRGKLLFLRVNEQLPIEEQPPKPIDWAKILDQAGLNWPDAREVEVNQVPPIFADEVHQWQVPFPLDTKHSLDVIAAAHQGRLVYFDRVHPWEVSPTTGETIQRGRQASEFFAIRAALWLLGIGVAAFLAWRHTLHGHADWRETWSMTAWVLILGSLDWLCGSRHSFNITEELAAAFEWLMVIVFCGAMAGLAYLAVEPAARRWWPWSIITLRRLLDGRLSDYRIWADVLLGLVVGLGAVWLRQLCTLANQVVGIAVSGLNDFDPSQNLLDHFGWRYRFAVLVSALLGAALQSLLVLTLVVGLKRIVKSTVVAAIIVVLVLAALSILGRGLISPVDWLARTLLLLIAAWVLLRFGLLASITALATYYAVNNSPITLDWSAWYSPTGLLVLLIFSAALATSWRMARPGYLAAAKTS
jgi:serine/threonine-protein kinase